MQLLEAARIRAYLEEVADELGSEGPDHEIVIVGGSLLAWHGIRSATFDVDTISRMSQELIEAVATVANRHGLARDFRAHAERVAWRGQGRGKVGPRDYFRQRLQLTTM